MYALFRTSLTDKVGNGDEQESIGWSYGRLYAFIYLNNPHHIRGNAVLQFSQVGLVVSYF